MAGYLIGPSSPTHSLIALVSVVSRGRGNGIVGVARMGSDSVVRQYIREGAAPVNNNGEINNSVAAGLITIQYL